MLDIAKCYPKLFIFNYQKKDIAKCSYDGTAHMETAAEKGKAIAAAVEGVEKYW